MKKLTDIVLSFILENQREVLIANYKSPIILSHFTSELLIKKIHSRFNYLSENFIYFLLKRSQLSTIEIFQEDIDYYSEIDFFKDKSPQSLTLHSNKISLLELLQYLNKKSLHYLNINGCNINKNIIHSLSNFQRLTTLHVAYSNIDNDCFQEICNYLSYVNELDISFTKIYSINYIYKLEKLIKIIFLSDLINFDENDLKQLNKLKLLEKLFLPRLPVKKNENNEFWEEFFKYSHWKYLQYFSLDGTFTVKYHIIRFELNNKIFFLFFFI